MIIRASDLGAAATTQAWASTAPLAAPLASPLATGVANGPKGLFDAPAGDAPARITADIGAGARGLSVAEHAGRILALLGGTPDARSGR